MTSDQIVSQTKRMGDMHREPYRDWIRRQCDRWGIAWREKYATPIDAPARDGKRQREAGNA